MKKFLRNVWIPLLAIMVCVGIISLRLIFTPVIIESGSMEPTLPVNTIAFIQPTETLKPTDIITFKQDTQVRATTHTFIGYAADGSLKTKGDANPAPDVRTTPLRMSDVMGKVVFTVPFLVPAYWTSIRGVVSLIIIALMVISVTMVLVKGRKGLQKENEINREELPRPTPSDLRPASS